MPPAATAGAEHDAPRHWSMPWSCAHGAVPYGAAADDVRRVWAPADLQRTFGHGGMGEATGTGLAEFTIIEVVVHGWDLAISTGQRLGMPDGDVEATLAIAHGLGEQILRAPGMDGTGCRRPSGHVGARPSRRLLRPRSRTTSSSSPRRS